MPVGYSVYVDRPSYIHHRLDPRTKLTALGTADAEPPPPIPGYDDLMELSRGRHAVVYRARQAAADRPVALKILRQDAAGDVELPAWR